MNPISEILNKINSKLNGDPLFYLSKDAERGIGLEGLIENYQNLNLNSNYISDQLAENKKGERFQYESILDLVKSPDFERKTQTKKFYAQLFQLNTPTERYIQELGGTLLNNSAELNRKFERKIEQADFLQRNNIKTPKFIVKNLAELSYVELKEEFGEKFIVQLDNAHTGLGTFFITDHLLFDEFKNQHNGNIVKISEYIDGTTLTTNAVIYRNEVYTRGIQYQITGIQELTSGWGTTVGNDFSFAKELSEVQISNIHDLVNNVGKALASEGFRGLFGVDFVVVNDEMYLIEINARQTANIAFQTQLELIQNQIPLFAIHICEFMDIDISNELKNFDSSEALSGSQIFLRSKSDNFKINQQLAGGIYRLQSDNSAIDWNTNQIKEGVILIDEEGDKPLIKQSDGYRVDNIDEGGFLILTQNLGEIRNKSDEICRFQFKNSILQSGGKVLSPWIIEAMKSIENILK